jgi:hypothetical protein
MSFGANKAEFGIENVGDGVGHSDPKGVPDGRDGSDVGAGVG